MAVKSKPHEPAKPRGRLKPAAKVVRGKPVVPVFEGKAEKLEDLGKGLWRVPDEPVELEEPELEEPDEQDELDETPTVTAEPGQAKAKEEPIRFTMLMADDICRQIAIGQPLQRICAKPGMPSVSRVQSWIRKYPRFAEMYEEARALQADYLADEMLMLVKELRTTIVPGRASALRAAADLLAKQAEWRAPRKYGPKMDLNINERPKTPEEIKAEILRLRTELGVPEGRIARIK